MVRLSMVHVMAPLSRAIWGMGNVFRNSSILDSSGSAHLAGTAQVRRVGLTVAFYLYVDRYSVHVYDVFPE